MSDCEYTGAAGSRQQIDQIALGGTYVSGEGASATIGRSTLSVTLGANTTLANLRDAFVAAINAEDNDAALAADEIRSSAGQLLPEFRAVFALPHPADTSKLLVYAKYVDDPFGTPSGNPMTVAESSASGTITRSSIQTATGPEDYTNTANWSGASLPTTGDRMLFLRGGCGPTYNLPTGTFQPAAIVIDQSVGVAYPSPYAEANLAERGYLIGRPDLNIEYGIPFPDYFQKDLQFNADHSAATLLTIGRGNGTGPQLVRLTFNGNDTLQFTGVIHNSGAPRVGGAMPHAIYLKSGTTNQGSLIILGGKVALAAFEGESASLGTASTTGLEIGQAGGAPPHVLLGSGIDINDTAVVIQGGLTELRCSVADDAATVSSIKIAGRNTIVDVVGDGTAGEPRLERVKVSRDSTLAFLTPAMIGASLINEGTIDLRRGAGKITVNSGASYENRGSGVIDDPATRLVLTEFTGGGSGGSGGA